MTIATETRRAGAYAGDDSTQVFAFSFKTFGQADLVVVSTTSGVDTVQTLTTHYTVSLNADQDASPGGSVTMLVAPATGTSLTILSARAYLQSLNVQNAGAMLPANINAALDNIVIGLQQIVDDLERMPRGALSDDVMARLPAASLRADGIFGFDASGDPAILSSTAFDSLVALAADIEALADIAASIVIVADADVDIGIVATNIADVVTVADALDAGTISDLLDGQVGKFSTLAAMKADDAAVSGQIMYLAGRTSAGDGGEGFFRWVTGDQSANVTADEVTTSAGDGGIWVAPASDLTGASGAWKRIIADHVSPLWWAADPSGSSDSIAAFDLAYLAARSFELPVSPGPGIFRLDSQWTIANPIAFRGVPPTLSDTPDANDIYLPEGGTWLHFNHTGIGIKFRDDANVGANRLFASFRGFGTKRNHPNPGVGWAPTTQSEDFRVEYRVEMDDVLALNPYNGWYIRSSGKLTLGNNVNCQPLNRGIWIERSSDDQTWERLHFWPYWSRNTNVEDYTVQNAVGVFAERVDGLHIGNFFHIRCHRALLIDDTSAVDNGVSGFIIDALYADDCGGAVEILTNTYKTEGYIGFLQINSDADVTGSGPGVHMHGTEASELVVGALLCSRAHEEVILCEDAAHQLTVTPLSLESWNRVSGGHYAMDAQDGAIIHLTRPPIFDGTPSNYYNTGAGGAIYLPIKGTAAIGEPFSVPDDITFTGIPEVSSVSPYWGLYETDGPTDEKYWRITVGSGNLNIQARDDANGGATNPLTITRTGTTIDQITLATVLAKINGNLQVTGDTIIATNTPASAAATGTTGQIAWDANYIYICTATNTWKRVAIATW